VSQRNNNGPWRYDMGWLNVSTLKRNPSSGAGWSEMLAACMELLLSKCDLPNRLSLDTTGEGIEHWF
jgi:hypothetical protein